MEEFERERGLASRRSSWTNGAKGTCIGQRAGLFCLLVFYIANSVTWHALNENMDEL